MSLLVLRPCLKTEKLSELKESLVQCSVKLIKTDPLQCEAMLQEELATTAHQFREAHSHLKRKIAQETASATRYENMLEEQNHIAEALAEIRTSLEEGNMQPQPSWKGLDLKGEISSFLRKYFPDQAANTAESTVGCDSHSKKQRGESADCSMEKLVFELLERFPGSIIIDPAIHSQTHIEMLVHCGAVEFTPDRKKSIRLTDMGC